MRAISCRDINFNIINVQYTPTHTTHCIVLSAIRLFCIIVFQINLVPTEKKYACKLIPIHAFKFNYDLTVMHTVNENKESTTKHERCVWNIKKNRCIFVLAFGIIVLLFKKKARTQKQTLFDCSTKFRSLELHKWYLPYILNDKTEFGRQNKSYSLFRWELRRTI